MSSKPDDEASSADERRRGARHPVEIAVEISFGSQLHIHATGNLSAGGAFFHRAIPYAVGTKVRLKLHLPGDPKAVECDGEVVNVPNKKDLGMGVRFLELSQDDRRRLDEFAAANSRSLGS